MSNNTNQPVIDVALLRKTLEHIEAHQNEWYQGSWRIPRTTSSCGTAMCFAGWATEIMDGEWISRTGEYVIANEADREWVAGLENGGCDVFGDSMIRERPNGRGEIHCSYRARRLLGLSQKQANDLFSGRNDLDDLREIVDRLERAAFGVPEGEAFA